jgi:hypothetical protein
VLIRKENARHFNLVNANLLVKYNQSENENEAATSEPLNQKIQMRK